MLKEYAYCECVKHASKDTALFINDVSLSVYFDTGGYNSTAYDKVDTLAMRIASEIKSPIIYESDNKKAIYLDCFKFYRSKRLDSLVKTLDKEIDATTWGNK